MEKIYAYIRQNLLAFSIGMVALCGYGYLTLTGKECFNCKQTEIYKSDQRQGGNHLRFRHK
jgi:hypothetical protein